MSSRKIRVTHLTTGLEVGGAQTALRYLVSRADRQMFDMDVVSLTSVGPIGEDLRRQGVRVDALEMKASRPNPLTVFKLMVELQRRRTDILQCWMYHADLLGALAGIPIRRTKVFWNLRQTNLDPSHSKPLTRATAYACSKLSRFVPHTIVCGSHAARDIHVEFGYDSRKMVVIENGVDVEKFAPSPESRRKLRQELGLSLGTKLIGLVARFHPQKDHRTFIRMARIVRANDPTAEFVLCGEGIDRGNAELMNWINQADLVGHIHLLGRRSDLEMVTAALDVGISSSASAEGGANTLIEALASGVPCVATDVGDSKRIVGSAGFVVAVADAEAMAQRTLTLLNAGAGRAYGLIARHRATDHFDIKSVVRQYEEIYGRAIN